MRRKIRYNIQYLWTFSMQQNWVSLIQKVVLPTLRDQSRSESGVDIPARSVWANFRPLENETQKFTEFPIIRRFRVNRHHPFVENTVLLITMGTRLSR